MAEFNSEITDSDMVTEVIELMGKFLGYHSRNYNVYDIQVELFHKYGRVHVDTIPSLEFFQTVANHRKDS